MNKIFAILALVGSSLIAGPSAAELNGFVLDGESVTSGETLGFVNEKGSTMSLTFTQSATQAGVWDLSGQYVNNAPNTGCQGHAYPLQGAYFLTNNIGVMSFSVVWSNSFENCNSVTGWTGYLTSGVAGVEIVTDWKLVYNGAAGGAITSGSDTFQYTSANEASFISE